MRYQNVYIRQKKWGNLFLYVEVEPNWNIDLGKEIPIGNIYYKVTYKVNNKRVAKIELSVADTESHIFYIKAHRCKFYRRDISDMGEGITVENMREFWRYLRNFQYDLAMRLHDMYVIYRDEMKEECRKAFEQVLEEL